VFRASEVDGLRDSSEFGKWLGRHLKSEAANGELRTGGSLDLCSEIRELEVGAGERASEIHEWRTSNKMGPSTLCLEIQESEVRVGESASEIREWRTPNKVGPSTLVRDSEIER